MSVQYDADASQKLTWPGVTAVLPSLTVAVNVIALPEVTVVTVLPPDVTPSVVVVATLASNCEAPHRNIHIAATKNSAFFK
jgi:hypothetical protein